VCCNKHKNWVCNMSSISDAEFYIIQLWSQLKLNNRIIINALYHHIMFHMYTWISQLKKKKKKMHVRHNKAYKRVTQSLYSLFSVKKYITLLFSLYFIYTIECITFIFLYFLGVQLGSWYKKAYVSCYILYFLFIIPSSHIFDPPSSHII
jgi:hypothetical protein